MTRHARVFSTVDGKEYPRNLCGTLHDNDDFQAILNTEDGILPSSIVAAHTALYALPGDEVCQSCFGIVACEASWIAGATAAITARLAPLARDGAA